MFSNPKDNIKQLQLTGGMLVADFGSGSGHYVISASEKVGDNGRVYAIDIQKSLLQKVKNLAEKENKHNIDILWGDIEQLGGTKLANNSIDAVIIANTFFQVENKHNIIAEARRVLKQNGRLMLVDWTDSFGGMGPAPENIVTESEAKNIFTENDFEFINRFDAGKHHYGLIFKKI